MEPRMSFCVTVVEEMWMLLFLAAARASALLKRLTRARPMVAMFVEAKGVCPPS
jgi:hypothetical protein